MTITRNLPGVLFAVVIGSLCLGLSKAVPVVSALLLAIVIGALLGNFRALPLWSRPGVSWSAKKFLRLGIVLLGLQLSISSLAELGVGGLILLLTVVATTFLGTLVIGRLLGIGRVTRFLIATGFSICGASAVAAMSGIVDPKQESEEEVAQAVALVTLFGTVSLLLLPVLSSVIGLSQQEAGLWIGASVHEVAQVVAASGAVGIAALSVATVAKLGRVVMLAPLIAAVGVRESLSIRAARSARGENQQTMSPSRPPIVPLYVLGFLGMILVRTFIPLPEEFLEVSGLVTTTLLAVAMFGLGVGVDIRKLINTGGRPALLGAFSTLIATCVALVGIFALRIFA